MRINCYAEEITNEVELVTKKLDDGRTFYGLRVFLVSPDVLHYGSDDDDRSAITFWVPWTKAIGNDPAVLYEMLVNMQIALDEVFR